METLSPSEHLQAPVEVGLAWRSGSPFAKVVQPLLQLYWAMYLHDFVTGGSIDSLATRCPLSTCQPKYVDGVVSLSRCLQIRFWYWALTMCPWPSVAGGSASSVFYLLNNFSLASFIFVKFSTRYNLQMNSSASWTLDVLRSPSHRCWSSLCTWGTCLMPFSRCGQKSRRWCHNRFRGWTFLSDSMYWKVFVLLLLGHAREDSNPGSLDCESAILPLS